MGSCMIWEIDFEDYKSFRNFRKRVEKVLHSKPRILCNHYIAGEEDSLNVIYDMGYLGYYEIIDFWKKKGNLKIKNLWELSICDRGKWQSIKKIFDSNGEDFKK